MMWYGIVSEGYPVIVVWNIGLGCYDNKELTGCMALRQTVYI